MKKLLALFLSMAMVLSLCACSSGGNDEQKDADNDSNQAAETTLDSFLENVEKGKDVKLVVWGAEEDQDLLNELIEGFKTEYADYANFTIELGVCSESTAKDTVLTDVEAAADVFAFADDQLKELVAGGALQEVSIDVSKIKEENVEVSVDAATDNGTLYAYPMTSDNGYFMFYNSDYFTEEDVQSLDTMMEVAAAQGKKIAMSFEEGWYTYSFFAGAGLEVGLAEDGVTTTCNWNATDTDIKGADVAEAMLAIANNEGFLSARDAEFVTGIQDGSIIAGVSGTWNSENAQKAWGDSYAASKLPTYTVAGNQVQMASFTGCKLIGVNKHSAEAGWAMVLAEWLTSYESQVTRFEKRLLGPSNLQAAESEEVQSNPAIAALAAQAEFATLQRVGGNFWSPTETFGGIIAQNNPDNVEIQTLLDNMVDGITAAVE
ncbi:MAG: extracellular solute-binding protein [Eubacterium sp.]